MTARTVRVQKKTRWFEIKFKLEFLTVYMNASMTRILLYT